MFIFFKRDWLLLLVLAGVACYGWHVYTTRYIPCVTPIGYAIAGVDERFGISQDEVQTELNDAAARWNTVIGKDVFVAQESGDLPVYLVYDKRQATAEKVTQIDNDIDAKRAEVNRIAAMYDTKLNEFERAQSQGRATRAMVQELNTLAQQYDTLRLDVNADIGQYNRTIPKCEYTEAKYVYDDKGARLYVYTFDNKKSLERVLTHEFGHALGLGHVEGKDSIMYPINSSENMAFTSQDKAELARACSEEQSLVSVLTERLGRLVGNAPQTEGL